jgi:phenylalanyl-tRNA synthetase beta chain
VTYEDVITFPGIRQDIAVSVPDDVPAGDLVAAARAAAGPELRELRVFDVYRGEQVGPGRKSIALALTYQAPDRTLTEDDAARLRGAIVSELARLFSAELR